MANNEQIITGLQAIVTALSQQADQHAMQARIFDSEGFSKLTEKYAGHAEEERGYVEKCTDRILDLGGEVKLEDKKSMPVFKDPIDFINFDLQVSQNALPGLSQLVEASRTDYTTFDLLKEYFEDEEQDMYWGETQLQLIEAIGKQNWLVQQV